MRHLAYPPRHIHHFNVNEICLKGANQHMLESNTSLSIIDNVTSIQPRSVYREKSLPRRGMMVSEQLA